jgi:hypothetical protein
MSRPLEPGPFRGSGVLIGDTTAEDTVEVVDDHAPNLM